MNRDNELIFTWVSMVNSKLSKYRLSIIVRSLYQCIKDIGEPPATDSLTEEYLPLDLLHSYLFLIQLMSACMQHHWLFIEYAQVQHGTQTQRKDPLPLDNSLAKHLLTTILLFLYYSSDAQLKQAIYLDTQYPLFSDKEYLQGELGNYNVFMSRLLTHNVMSNLYESSCRIIHFISASNWSVVFPRWKSALIQVSTSVNDDDSEVIELRIITYAALNAQRLAVVLTELQGAFLHCKRNVQSVIAAYLRRGIWNWFEGYSAEAETLHVENKRMGGNPELLFDMCNSLCTSTRKKAYFWPLQVMLLLLCPDILTNVTMQTSAMSVPKKGQFLNSLKQAILGDRIAEVAVVCYTDICMVAAKLPRDEGTAVWSILPDVILDMETWIFDSKKPFAHSAELLNSGVQLDDRLLLTRADAALSEVSDTYARESTIRFYINDDAPLVAKACKLKSGAFLSIPDASNRSSMTGMKSLVAEKTRQLFIKLTKMHCERVSATQSTHDPFPKHMAPTSLPGSTSSSPSGHVQAHHHKPFSRNKHFRRISSAIVHTINTPSTIDIDHVLVDLLQIIRVQPQTILDAGSGANVAGEVYQVILCILKLLKDPAHALADNAATCLVRLHQPDAIMCWDSSNQYVYTFWKVSSQIIFTLAKQILNFRPDNGIGLKQLLNVLKNIVASGVSFLELHMNTLPTQSHIQKWLQTFIGLEVVLLTLLCSWDDYIYGRVTDCIELLCNDICAKLLEEHNVVPLTMVQNRDVYRELLDLRGTISLGRKSHLRHVWTVLRRMKHPTPGTIAAWEEIWKRWLYMTPHIINGEDGSRVHALQSHNGPSGTLAGSSGHHLENLLHPSSPTPHQSPSPSPRIDYSAWDAKLPPLDESRLVEWENYTGFLSSLGQIVVPPAPPYVAKTSNGPITDQHGHLSSKSGSAEDLPSTAAAAGSATDERDGERGSSPNMFDSTHITNNQMVEQFVGTMVELLVCKNLMIRERVRDIMGFDMATAFYSIMIRHFSNQMKECFCNELPIYDNTRILLVEQMITVLRIILARKDSSKQLTTIDLSDLIYNYTTYINMLENSENSTKIKIKMCHLCESYITQLGTVTTRNEIVARTRLLNYIIGWTSSYHQRDVELHKLGDFQLDLDVACLKAIAIILYKLPVQPIKPTRERESIHMRSKIFYKYFTFFLWLLNRCKDAQIKISAERKATAVSMKVSMISTLKNTAIVALSNLLSANVDVGLKYSLTMGYHEDVQMVMAFMQVLTNILKQDTEFETLAETIMIDRCKKLVQYLFQYDCAIPMALIDICSVSEIADVATALFTTFSSEGKALELLELLITKEVKSTATEGDLLRNTSVAIRYLSIFAKINGTEYLKAVLKPVMKKLAALPAEELFFELDPAKAEKGFSVQTNKRNVINATTMIIEAICKSADLVPASIKAACHIIEGAAKTTFPECRYTAVGSFIFLRFFCPAIVSPESAGLLLPDEIPRNLRRGLLIIAKLIQNLANNVLFGSKELYMIILNDFVTANIYRITTYLRQISNVDDIKSGKCGVVLPMMDQDYILLRSVLMDHMEDIQKNLSTKSLLHFEDQSSAKEWESFITSFNNLLIKLGPPSDTKRNSGADALRYRHVHSCQNSAYTEFMRINSAKSANAIARGNICYDAGVSKEGHQVVYFIYRHIDAINTAKSDCEDLIYHIFQMWESFAGRSVMLVLDATQFHSSNFLISTEGLNQFMKLVPPEFLNQIKEYMIYNPNHNYIAYLENEPNLLAVVPRTVHFAYSLADFHAHVNPSEVHLPLSTTALCKDASFEFPNVLQIMRQRELSVTVKISAEYVQIMSTKKQPIFGIGASCTNDVYHISEIKSIRCTNLKKDIKQLSFVSTIDKVTIKLRSVNASEMTNQLLRNQKEFKNSKPDSYYDRIIRPNDVPGRLLNMAFLNIGAADAALRSMAYKLLYSLCHTFHFNVTCRLLDNEDLALPANCMRFVTKLSEQLAIEQPGLTLEFLNEALVGFDKSEHHKRLFILFYIQPWVPNLAITCLGNTDDIARTKEVLKTLVRITIESPLQRVLQFRIWALVGGIQGLWDLVLETFLDVANQHGIGSNEAEVLADTAVSLSSSYNRHKLIAHMFRLLRLFPNKPTKSVVDHPLWSQVAILMRFLLMMTFDVTGPAKHVVADVMHLVTLLAGEGPTLVRATVLGITVNIINAICASPSLPAQQRRDLQQILIEFGERRCQLIFGLRSPDVHPYNVTFESLETTKSEVVSVDLTVIQSVVNLLLRILDVGAPTVDMGNEWRARWMSHVTSTTFQSNPAIQPRTFVALGCLGRNYLQDDVLFQVFCTLRLSLQSFDTEDASLPLSIVMCLKSVVENMGCSPRYLTLMFWTTMGLVSMNHADLFCASVDLLTQIMTTMDAYHFFKTLSASPSSPMLSTTSSPRLSPSSLLESPGSNPLGVSSGLGGPANGTATNFLLDALEPAAEVWAQLDALNGVSFRSQFSFAVLALLMKGWRYPQGHDVSQKCLLSFLKSCTPRHRSSICTNILGFVAGLVPVARKKEAHQEILHFAGISSTNGPWEQHLGADLPNVATSTLTGGTMPRSYFIGGSRGGGSHSPSFRSGIHEEADDEANHCKILDICDIPDEGTALLLFSALALQLGMIENEGDQLYLYELLSHAAAIMPQAFTVVYPTVLSKMNQLMLTTRSAPLLSAIQSILLKACANRECITMEDSNTSLEDELAKIGFTALADPSYGLTPLAAREKAQLVSQLIDRLLSSVPDDLSDS
ncbi:hypothetical protein BC940DRAFT_357286 [Gongronella butleri]|nr:hypothetical protein BC940DRAFT_357286 [Gongronella butleri]